jgi:hypothetical protein
MAVSLCRMLLYWMPQIIPLCWVSLFWMSLWWVSWPPSNISSIVFICCFEHYQYATWCNDFSSNNISSKNIFPANICIEDIQFIKYGSRNISSIVVLKIIVIAFCCNDISSKDICFNDIKCIKPGNYIDRGTESFWRFLWPGFKVIELF